MWSLSSPVLAPSPASYWPAAFYGGYLLFRDVSDHLAEISVTLAFINISLGLFNMLPGFPLDGGRVLRSIIWGVTGNYWRATFMAARGGQVVAGLLIVGGLAMLLFLREFQGIWMAAIGWFLAMAASSSLNQFKLRKRMDGYSAEDLMTTSIETAPPRISLEVLATEYILQSRQDVYFVVRDESLLGMITFKAASRVPRNRWSHTTVEETMMPVESIPVITPRRGGTPSPGDHRGAAVPPGSCDEGRSADLTQQTALHNLNLLESMN